MPRGETNPSQDSQGLQGFGLLQTRECGSAPTSAVNLPIGEQREPQNFESILMDWLVLGTVSCSFLFAQLKSRAISFQEPKVACLPAHPQGSFAESFALDWLAGATEAPWKVIKYTSGWRIHLKSSKGRKRPTENRSNLTT